MEYEETPDPEMELEDITVDQPDCPLESDLDWDESFCGEIERRILSRVLGG